MTECIREQDITNPTISIVLPIRNRWGVRVRNCMDGIQLQSQDKIEVILADYGSSEEGLKNLIKTVSPYDCTIYHHETDDVWSLSGARNLGLRRAKAKYTVTLDVDGIMEPNVIQNTLSLSWIYIDSE